MKEITVKFILPDIFDCEIIADIINETLENTTFVVDNKDERTLVATIVNSEDNTILIEEQPKEGE